jgi:Mlc titration factor MtfA (ptsG expression regulator)
MLIRWLRNRRRRALLAQPFPTAWIDVLQANVLLYSSFGTSEQERIRDYLRVFVAEKHWEGCGGLEMIDEVRVTIAAQVAILVLGLDEQLFRRVQSILVYPALYVAPGRTTNHAGLVEEESSARAGEAWYRGPVILSWPEVLSGGRLETDGRNVVFHEFAHQLDMLNDRSVDGMPPLPTAEQSRRWAEVIGLHYRQLVHACERGQPTLLDCYGATSLAEFFAVATETFFMLPDALRHYHPALYAILRDFYRQDRAAGTEG